MNRDELRPTFRTALNRYWRVSLDRGGPVPELLADLERIAEQYAVAHAGRVTGRQELRAEAAMPVLADYDTPERPALEIPSETLPESGLTPVSATAQARTRTRTRRNTG